MLSTAHGWFTIQHMFLHASLDAQATQGRGQRRERLEAVPVIPWATFLMLALLGTAFGFAFMLVAHPQAPALR